MKRMMMFLVTMLVCVYSSSALAAEPNWPANDNCAGILQIGAFEPKLSDRTITVDIPLTDMQKCIAGEWKIGIGMRVYDSAKKHWLESTSYMIIKSDQVLRVSFDLAGHQYYRIRIWGENLTSKKWLVILNTPYTRVDMNNNPAYEFMADTGKSAITQVPDCYGKWSW